MIEKNEWPAFTCKLTTPGSRVTLLDIVAWLLEKMAGEQHILAVSVLFLSLSALAATFQCCGFLLSLLACFGALANVT